MPNWVHNGITVQAPAKIVYGLAEILIEQSVEIEKEDLKRGPTSRRIAPSFEKRYTDHELSYGTLRDLVMESQEYKEFKEIIEPEGVLVDFDTTLQTPGAFAHPDIEGLYEYPADDEITYLRLHFDTKWRNQNYLFSTALLEMAYELDQELGKLAVATSWGSEELLHFENSTLVTNQLTVNDEVIKGPVLLYKSETHRNGLLREDITKLPDLQVFELRLSMDHDPIKTAERVLEEINHDGMGPLIEWNHEYIKTGQLEDNEGYHYLTFKTTADQLMAGRFYRAVAVLGLSIYTSEVIDDMPYVAMPYFQNIGQHMGNVVPVLFDDNSFPGFIYGERLAHWNSPVIEEEIKNDGMPF